MDSGFKVTTTSFTPGKALPKKYSPRGEDYTPQLSWTGAPEGTKSYAIIIDDPDAPCGVWAHWLVKNIPATTTSMAENTIPGEEVINSWGFKKYKGPQPPSGTHRYFFKVYALKVEKMKATKLKDFYSEVEKNKLASAEIMGTFSR